MLSLGDENREESGKGEVGLSNPKISIITVVYNGEKTISDTITSVLGQNYDNLEYIVVDGASSDSTLEIVRSFSDHRLSVVSESDAGMYDALNKGIRRATGDIVGLLHADDIYAGSQVLEEVAAVFHDKSLDCAFADLVFVDPMDMMKVVRKYDSSKFSPNKFRFGWMPAHPTFFARREAFERFGLYKTNYKIAADYELLVRFLYCNHATYRYVPRSWVRMRTGGVSTSGLASTILLNREVVRACRENGMYTNLAFIMSKYFVKILGVLGRKDK